jgi:hypothetical protein
VNDTDSLLNSLKGELVWGVKRSHGSMFFWECGKPHLRLTGPTLSSIFSKLTGGSAPRRLVHISGDIHILCEADEWIISYKGKEICRAEDSDEKIDEALRFIDGQKILKAYIKNEREFVFEFDIETELCITKPVNENYFFILYREGLESVCVPNE